MMVMMMLMEVTSKCLDIRLTLHPFCHVAWHRHVARVLDGNYIWVLRFLFDIQMSENIQGPLGKS